MEEIRRTIKLSIEVSLMYRSEKRESKISGRREGRKVLEKPSVVKMISHEFIRNN